MPPVPTSSPVVPVAASSSGFRLLMVCSDSSVWVYDQSEALVARRDVVVTGALSAWPGVELLACRVLDDGSVGGVVADGSDRDRSWSSPVTAVGSLDRSGDQVLVDGRGRLWGPHTGPDSSGVARLDVGFKVASVAVAESRLWIVGADGLLRVRGGSWAERHNQLRTVGVDAVVEVVSVPGGVVALCGDGSLVFVDAAANMTVRLVDAPAEMRWVGGGYRPAGRSWLAAVDVDGRAWLMDKTGNATRLGGDDVAVARVVWPGSAMVGRWIVDVDDRVWVSGSFGAADAGDGFVELPPFDSERFALLCDLARGGGELGPLAAAARRL